MSFAGLLLPNYCSLSELHSNPSVREVVEPLLEQLKWLMRRADQTPGQAPSKGCALCTVP